MWSQFLFYNSIYSYNFQTIELDFFFLAGLGPVCFFGGGFILGREIFFPKNPAPPAYLMASPLRGICSVHEPSQVVKSDYEMTLDILDPLLPMDLCMGWSNSALELLAPDPRNLYVCTVLQ